MVLYTRHRNHIIGYGAWSYMHSAACSMRGLASGSVVYSMKVSIAICIWNCARLLDQTLSQLKGLRIPADVEYEVLVVNNSTDATDEVISAMDAACPIKSVFEPRQGLLNARNAAVRETTGRG